MGKGPFGLPSNGVATPARDDYDGRGVTPERSEFMQWPSDFGLTLVIAGAVFAPAAKALGWLLIVAGLLSMIVGLAVQPSRRQGRPVGPPAAGRHAADDSSARPTATD